jgi:hypothetical protein
LGFLLSRPVFIKPSRRLCRNPGRTGDLFHGRFFRRQVHFDPGKSLPLLILRFRSHHPSKNRVPLFNSLDYEHPFRTRPILTHLAAKSPQTVNSVTGSSPIFLVETQAILIVLHPRICRLKEQNSQRTWVPLHHLVQDLTDMSFCCTSKGPMLMRPSRLPYRPIARSSMHNPLQAKPT